MYDTLHINLWGGSNFGKTAVAQQVSGALKAMQLRADYVPEYAKDLVRDNVIHLYDQMEILAEQHRRLKRGHGHLEVIVTDAPLLMTLFHTADEDKAPLRTIILNRTAKWRTLNYLLQRDITDGSYDTEGRYEDVAGSLKKHAGVTDILASHDPAYQRVRTDKAVDRIIADVLAALRGTVKPAGDLGESAFPARAMCEAELASP
ncbi:hypothetical protein F6X40_09725 [Paraburkholderia sp. UCT31]|uniref:hypothetical protein n=1 Tax=Paraburkholderia sp. UCT31 TaxID=2615209 RepID=UPI0016556707|nr:hypothetical protein [Paraburkholderia sp. UCT31]MBC8737086.1 hypothetical protein [Paraburkholderia sp. UCT31]